MHMERIGFMETYLEKRKKPGFFTQINRHGIEIVKVEWIDFRTNGDFKPPKVHNDWCWSDLPEKYICHWGPPIQICLRHVEEQH